MTDEQKRWHREECARYKAELPDWDIYAGTLKKSPYLVSWDKLSEEVKGYDRDAVKAWPAVLASAGLAILRK